jgi:hypothetical protein
MYTTSLIDINSSPWLYPAEVTTLRIRSKGAACATMSNRIFNFLVVKITPSAIASIGYQTYIIFTVFVCPVETLSESRIWSLSRRFTSCSQKQPMYLSRMLIIRLISREKSLVEHQSVKVRGTNESKTKKGQSEGEGAKQPLWRGRKV